MRRANLDAFQFIPTSAQLTPISEVGARFNFLGSPFGIPYSCLVCSYPTTYPTIVVNQ
jgi:hypothetical protein